MREWLWLFAAIWIARSAAMADDWPRFRGPAGQGHSAERRLPTAWSENEHIAWNFLSEEGVATVLAAGRSFKPVATNRLDGCTLASMAISDGAIYLRSESHLYRIESTPSGQ
jgi:hypothetical protein